MKRILLIANADSVFTFDYVKKMLEEGYEIVLINQLDRFNISYNQFSDYYRQHGVIVKSMCYGVSSQEYFYWYIKSLGNFDVCHVMYLTGGAALLAWRCKSQFESIVVNYWGSDFYRVTNKEEKEQLFLLEYADVVIAPTEEMGNDLRSKYANMVDKIKVVHFTGSVIPMLREDICREDDLPIKKYSNKLIVSCGYTGAQSQQHKLMIRAIKMCPPKVLERIHVVFQMTYGLNNQYRDEIEELLKDAPFDYTCLYDYLSDEQVIALRRMTDVFIYVETTDAFSASLQEYLYCGSVVLLADWLKYPMLESNNIYMEKVSDVIDLAEKITAIVEKYPMYKEISMNNSSKMDKMWNQMQNVRNWSEHYRKSNLISESNEEEYIRYMLFKNEESLTRRYMYERIQGVWLKERISNNMPVLRFINEQGWKRILLYGAGTLGELCYREIKDDSTIILDLCDQSALELNTLWWEREILRPQEIKEEEYDGIIVTPIHVFESVRKQYDITACVSLYDIIMKKE